MSNGKHLGDWATTAFDAVITTVVVLVVILYAMSKLTDLFFLDR